ncbi:alpha/beta hydrolase [Bombella intestini]|uniref:alpha/beta hydrolase n=1 Tax=Bombella intestini TaxID=1539051 RepID=UPI000985F225|nr:alpha/beta hydrolase [Bombella intestini]
MKARRQFLKGCSVLSVAALAGGGRYGLAQEMCPVKHMLHDAANFYPLWPEVGAVEQPRVAQGGRVFGIHVPGLHIMRPARPNGAAIIIAAGGGYGHIAVGHEALPVARWLVSLGVTAAILLYRLPKEGWAEGMEAPLADARQALHMLQSGQGGEAIDVRRVGLMGFSAGGHLMGLTALQKGDIPLALLMLLYPVVSVAPPFTGSRTSRVCLGNDPTPVRAERWSLPPHVRDDAPPLFMAYALDDPIVLPAQEALLLQAYQRHRRPCEEHRFSTGGHGFGLGRKGGPTEQWPILAERWMKQRGFI